MVNMNGHSNGATPEEPGQGTPIGATAVMGENPNGNGGGGRRFSQSGIFVRSFQGSPDAAMEAFKGSDDPAEFMVRSDIPPEHRQMYLIMMAKEMAKRGRIDRLELIKYDMHMRISENARGREDLVQMVVGSLRQMTESAMRRTSRFLTGGGRRAPKENAPA